MLQENVGKFLVAQVAKMAEYDGEREIESEREIVGGDKEPAPETDVANFSIFIISALVFWRLWLRFLLSTVECRNLFVANKIQI